MSEPNDNPGNGNSNDESDETLNPQSSDRPQSAKYAADIASVPSRIARYRIDKVLGQGAFGRVYLGFDEELVRKVAIKVPHPDRVKSQSNIDQYLAEARTLASLDHPSIVPVYDVGRTKDGLCYIVSKFIEGSDLAVRLKDWHPTHLQSARIVAVIADALHHAHKKGFVHRDIKPANIMIDRDDNPFVTDFGLALEEQDVGKRGGWAGTPVYMSPEQARGEANLVDGRSDIFSLGAVFYEMLTQRWPFQGDSNRDIMKRITSVNARPPRQRDDTIPVELERICLRALSIQLSARYTTALDVADDLFAFLATADGSSSGSHSTAHHRVRESGTTPSSGPAQAFINANIADESRHDDSTAAANIGIHHERAGTAAVVTRPLISRRRIIYSLSAAAIIGLGIVLGVLTLNREAETAAQWTRQYSEQKPKIIGIYPKDGFGSLRKAGLHVYVDEHPEVKVIDLDNLTIEQMKNDDTKQLLRVLNETIENDNVLAIVGPPITECTKSILAAVAKSGRRIPVFVESAGAPGEIGWTDYEAKIPIFRISSGIDRRAAEIGLCIKECLEAGKPVHLLIEEQQLGKRTYGEHLYEEIKYNLKEWNVDPKNLDAHYFPSTDIDSVMPEIKRLVEQPGLILVLGLGDHYQAIATRWYKPSSPGYARPNASLVGWMNAYKMTAEYYASDDFEFNLLYEITDFDITDRGPKPAQFGIFQRDFGDADPAVRDQAFSFDGGYCIVETYLSFLEQYVERKPGYYPLMDEQARTLFETRLRAASFRGITGDIRFGEAGQNKDGRLEYVRFDKEKGAWMPVIYKELFTH